MAVFLHEVTKSLFANLYKIYQHIIVCSVTEFYVGRELEKEQDVQIRSESRDRRNGKERERCIKGHEHDSDMHDICEYIAFAH